MDYPKKLDDCTVYHWTDFNFDLLDRKVLASPKSKWTHYYNHILTLDTETSQYTSEILFVSDWSFSIDGKYCVWGGSARECIEFLDNLKNWVVGIRKYHPRIVIYVHNYSYDYMFLRDFAIEKWGEPSSSLATKPHKYIFMRFGDIEFRDSYILTQRSLAKLTKDMGTTHKLVGEWDYKKLRVPNGERTEGEWCYMLIDAIALANALDKFFAVNGVNIATVPYTATGFVRELGKKSQDASDKYWYSKFCKMQLTLEQYRLMLECYHGGYTHANRYAVGITHTDLDCYDFTSSYPSVMCYEKFPMGKFYNFEGRQPTPEEVIKLSDKYAIAGRVYFENLTLHKSCPMPPIAYHKCNVCTEPVLDNGKVVKATECLVPFTDPDIPALLENYCYTRCEIVGAIYAEKAYLPRWFTESFIMPLYHDKCTLKNVDPVNYMISKGHLNSTYGMAVQKIVRDETVEDMSTGEWVAHGRIKDDEYAIQQLNKFYGNRNKYIAFQWGVWVTAFAQRNLYLLGGCCDEWLYSDTDSVKGKKWNKEKLDAYNAEILRKSDETGLGHVNYNGTDYYLGLADFDGHYTEFKTLGSKRYCYRENGQLHITVAGVPKSGVAELNDDIRNFRRNMIFRETGKTTAIYNNVNSIHSVEITVENGEKCVVEYGSSIRLDEVEYKLDMAHLFDPDTGLPYLIDIDYSGDF